MKKAISIFLSVMMLFSLTLTACAAEETDIAPNSSAESMQIVLQVGNPMMTVNGTEKEIDPGRGTVPVVVNDRTLVPVRAIVEEMGGTVGWEEEQQQATLTLGTDTIRLTLGSKAAYLNDEMHTLDVAPESINDRTMLPIRFIAESFHFNVGWDEEQQLITITKDVQPDTPVVTPEPEEPEVSGGSNAAVVYFSATGNTRALAEKIAAAAGCEIYEIVPTEPYTSEDLNYNTDSSRANQELESDARPEIEEMDLDIAAYDVILLGYPKMEQGYICV